MSKKPTYQAFIVVDFYREKGSTLPLPSEKEIGNRAEMLFHEVAKQYPDLTLYDYPYVHKRGPTHCWGMEYEVQGVTLRVIKSFAKRVANAFAELGRNDPVWDCEAIPFVLVSAD